MTPTTRQAGVFERVLTPLGALVALLTLLGLIGVIGSMFDPIAATTVEGQATTGAASAAPEGSSTGGDGGSEQPIAGATLVCPLLGGEAAADDSLLGLALGGVADGPRVARSGAQSRALVGKGNLAAPDYSITARAVPVQAAVSGRDSRAHALRARGPLAPGLVAEQSRLATGAETFGVADLACPAPQRDFWFVGASSATGSRTLLVLANVGSTAALADVTAWDETGELVTPSLENVAVAPAQSEIVRIDALAPGSERIALKVSIVQGLMAASVEHRVVDGLDPRGLTWLPAVAPPARQHVVGGIPATGGRRLQILNPQDAAAVVSLRLRGADGSFVATGLDAVAAPANSVTEVDLAGVALDSGIAVEMVSDVPVTAAVILAVGGTTGLSDIAVAPAASALGGPAGTWVHAESALTTTLTFSAAKATSVRLDLLDGTGATVSTLERALLGEATFELPIVVPAGASPPFAAVITPAEPGTLVVARRVSGAAQAPGQRGGQRRGELLDVVTLDEARVGVAARAVVHDLLAGLPVPPPG